MNAKIFVTTALLLFVVVSVGMIIVREGGPERGRIATAPTRIEAGLSAVPATSDGVDVYYFHGDTRCPTCRRIEALARESVESSFSDELAGGQVRWSAVNYDLAENAHFLADFELIAPTVVVVERRGGQQAAWQNLSRVWELVGDRAAFSAYVRDSVNTHLAETVSP